MDVEKDKREHWSRQARHFAESRTHGNQDVLAALVAKVEPKPEDIVLDVGTGTAHTAMAFTPLVRTVCASDIAIGMMEAGRALMRERGIENLYFCLGDAVDLPFADNSFDIVSCRSAAHHFHNFEKAIGELARVTKPGGRVFFTDSTAPEEQDLADFVNEVEVIRDHTHVCNRSPLTVHGLFAKNGLKVDEIVVRKGGGPVPTPLEVWFDQSATPPDRREKVKQMFRNATPAQAEAMSIRVEGEEIQFRLGHLQIFATKPRY